MKIINEYNRDSILKVYNNFISHYDEIESLILEIPNEFNGLYVMSFQRKDYYLKTLKIRLDYIYENYIK